MGMGYMKGQGATEYLVILAVAIIIALIALGVISQGSGDTSSQEKVSRAYWRTGVYPLAIEDYKYWDGYYLSWRVITLVIVNNGDQTITIPSGGISIGTGGVVTTGPQILDGLHGSPEGTTVVIPSQTRKNVLISTTLLPNCKTTFSVEVNITYSTQKLGDLKIIGAKPLIGRCSDD